MNEPTYLSFHSKRAALALACLIAGLPGLRAQTYTVTNTNDSGAGSLRAAITSADGAAAGSTVTINSTLTPHQVIVLTGGQLVLDTAATVNVELNNTTLDAGGASRVLQVTAGTVTFGLTSFQGGSATGTAGGEGIFGGGAGGGGAGLGGAILLSGGHLILRSDSFAGNSATGGMGGDAFGPSDFDNGGAGGNGGVAGSSGGGAGGAGEVITAGPGGAGGFGGGGGGGGGALEGAGGTGGAGGFGAGGGGGGASVIGAPGGAGSGNVVAGDGEGGSEFSGGAGGGGAALGGTVFVNNGATLTLVNTNLNGPASVTGGAGGEGAAAGSGAGSDLYLPTGTTSVTILPGRSETIAGTIAEMPNSAAALTINGGGTLAINAANTYSGGTTITDTTVAVGNMTALGTGHVTNDGTLTVGNGNMAIMVSGYTQTSTGTLLLNDNLARNDYVGVDGTAQIAGSVVLNFVGLPKPMVTLGHIDAPKQFLVLGTIGGYTGTFNTGTYTNTENLPPDVVTRLEYLPDVILANAYPVGFFSQGGLNANQRAIVGPINTALGTLTTNALIMDLGSAVTVNPEGFGGYLDQLTSLDFARFTSATAFNNAAFTTEQMDNYFASHRDEQGNFIASAGGIDYSGLTYNDPDTAQGLQEIRSRLLAWNPAPSTGLLSDVPSTSMGGTDMKDMKETKTMTAMEEPANRWNAFVAGNVVLAQDFSDPQSGLAHTGATTGGVQLGVDYTFCKSFLAGVTFGYGHTDADLDSIGSSATVDTYSPGVYASFADKGWYANAMGSYGFTSYTQDRNVSIGAFGGTAHSAPTGDQIVGDLDGGYDFHHGALTYGPTLGVQYVHLDVNGYNESGATDADLLTTRDESDSLRSRLGGRVSYAIQDAGMIFTPHLDASWQHEFLDQARGVTDQFDATGVGSFFVRTQDPSRDSAIADLGLDAQLNKTITVFTDYSVQAGQSNYFGQSVQAGVKVGF